MTYDIPDWLRHDMRRNRAALKARRREKLMRKVRPIVLVAIALLTLGALLLQPYTITYERQEPSGEPEPRLELQSAYATTYFVTGYNTVPEQTDSTPCIAASGHDICGRDDVVACPRAIALGTEIVIDGKSYVCLDRLAPKYDHRIDISCDKDMQCPAAVTGHKEVIIKQ